MSDLQKRLNVHIAFDTGEVGRGFRDIDRDAESASRSLDHADDRVDHLGGSLKRLAVLAAGLGIGAMFQEWARSAGQIATAFDRDLTTINTLVGVSREQVNAWRGDLLKLGPEVAQLPSQLAPALFSITSGGERGAAALDVLRDSGIAAALGLGEIPPIAKLTVSALEAYGRQNLTSADAVEILRNAVRAGNLDAAELAPTLGKVTSTGATLGVTFDEVNAFIARFTKLGGSAAEGVTGLSGIFMTFLGPGNAAKEVMKSLGYSADELRTALRERGLAEVLVELITGLEGNEEALRKLIPSEEGFKAALAAVGETGEDYLRIAREVGTVTGDMGKTFQDLRRTSPDLIFKELQARGEALKIVFGDALVRGLAAALSEMRDFSDLERELAELGHQVGEALGGVVRALAVLLDNLELVKAVLLTLLALKVVSWINAITASTLAWAGANTIAAGSTAAVGTAVATVSPIVNQYGRAIVTTTAATNAATASSSRFVAAGLGPLGVVLAVTLGAVLLLNEGVKKLTRTWQAEIDRMVAAGKQVRIVWEQTTAVLEGEDLEAAREHLARLRAEVAPLAAELKDLQAKDAALNMSKLAASRKGDHHKATRLAAELTKVQARIRDLQPLVSRYNIDIVRMEAGMGEVEVRAAKLAAAKKHLADQQAKNKKSVEDLTAARELALLALERARDASLELADALAGELAAAGDAVAGILEDRVSAGMTQAQRETAEWTGALEALAAAIQPMRDALERAVEATTAYYAAAAEKVRQEKEGAEQAVELAKLEAERAGTLGQLQEQIAALLEREDLLRQAQAQSADVLDDIQARLAERLGAISQTTAEILAEAEATRQGKEALAAYRDQMDVNAAMAEVYQQVLAETGDQIEALNAAIARGAAVQELQKAREEMEEGTGDSWDKIAGDTSKAMGDAFTEMVVDWDFDLRNMESLYDSFLKRVLAMWIRNVTARKAVETSANLGQSGGGQSGSASVSGSGLGGLLSRWFGGGGGGGGMSAAGGIGLGLFGLYMASIMKKGHEAREHSFSSGVSIGKGQWGYTTPWAGADVGNLGIDSQKLYNQLKASMEDIVAAMGGVLDAFPRLAIRFRQDGKEFEVKLGETLIGVFSNLDDAIEQGLMAAIAGADISGLSENMQILLDRLRLSSSVTKDMEQFLSDVALARRIDTQAISENVLALEDRIRALKIEHERVKELGLSRTQHLDLMKREINAITASIQARIDATLGKSQEVADFLRLQEEARAYQERLNQVSDELGQLLDDATRPRNIPEAPPGSPVGGSQGTGGSDAENQIGGLEIQLGRLAETVVDVSAETRDAREQIAGITDQVVRLSEEAESSSVELQNLDLDELERAGQALSDRLGGSLLDRLLRIVDSEEARSALIELNALQEIEYLRMRYEELKALGRLTAAQIAMYDELMAEAIARLEAGFDLSEVGRSGAGRQRRDAREEFRDASRVVALALAGMSEEALETRDDLRQLADTLEEARKNGIGAAEAARRYADSLALMTRDILADVRERRQVHGETEIETTLRQLEQERAAVLQQLELVATAEAERLGVAVGQILAPLVAEVDEVYQLDQVAALRDEIDRLADAGDAAGIQDLVDRFAALPGLADAAAAGLERIEEARAAEGAAIDDELRASRDLAGGVTEVAARLRDLARGMADQEARIREVYAGTDELNARLAELIELRAAEARQIGRDWLGQYRSQIPELERYFLELERRTALAELRILSAEQSFLDELASAGLSLEDLGAQINRIFDEAVESAEDAAEEIADRAPAFPDRRLAGRESAADLFEQVEAAIEALADADFASTLDGARELNAQIGELRELLLSAGNAAQRARGEAVIAEQLQGWEDKAIAELRGTVAASGLRAEHDALIARIEEYQQAFSELGLDFGRLAAATSEAWEDFWEMAHSDIRSLYERYRSGEGQYSTVTNQEALSYAQDRFFDLQARLAGDPRDLEAIEALPDAFEAYIKWAEITYSGGADFDRIFRDAFAFIGEFLGDSGTGTTPDMSRGEPDTGGRTAAEVEERDYRVAQAQREDALRDEVGRLRDQVGILTTHVALLRGEHDERFIKEEPVRRGMQIFTAEHNTN